MGPTAKPALSTAIEFLDRPSDNWHWEADTVRKVIAAIGPEAVAAVPKLIRNIDNESYTNPIDALLALAAIGPSANAAIPVIEDFVKREKITHRLGIAHYALFCIRGETQDLSNMIDVLKQGDHKYWIARFLIALGVKAKPMADEVRQMLDQEAFAQFHERLKLFLKRVDQGRGPEAIVGW